MRYLLTYIVFGMVSGSSKTSSHDVNRTLYASFEAPRAKTAGHNTDHRASAVI